MTDVQKTTVDWLRFRTQGEPGEVLEALRPMFGRLGGRLRFGDYGRGCLGFQRSLPVMVDDMPVARCDFGGDSQRGWLRTDMSGKGCAQVEDWDALETVESLPRAELTRLDLALTTWRNEVNHDLVKTAYERGRFTTCGRPPNLESRLNSDKRKGQTLYVGSRTGHKFFRGYQKGYEMASKLGRVPGDLVAIDGFPVEDIYRCEMEFKNKDADLPWEMVDRRDQYFAGSYPFCADILPGIEADILQRRPEKGPQRELEAALANCRTQYGATLYTALRAYGGDIGAVWDKVIGDKHNPALVEAGVLLYEHE